LKGKKNVPNKKSAQRKRAEEVFFKLYWETPLRERSKAESVAKKGSCQKEEGGRILNRKTSYQLKVGGVASIRGGGVPSDREGKCRR